MKSGIITSFGDVPCDKVSCALGNGGKIPNDKMRHETEFKLTLGKGNTGNSSSQGASFESEVEIYL